MGWLANSRDEKAKHALLDAAALIDRHGWNRMEMRNPRDGSFCMIGALRQTLWGTVNRGNSRPSKVYDVALQRLLHTTGIGGSGANDEWRLAVWNDKMNATEVVTTMREAAK